MVDIIFVVIGLDFSLSPTVETLWAEIGRSRRFSKGGGSLWAQISEGRGHRPPIVGVRKLEWLPYRSCGIKISAVHPSFTFVTIHASDGPTDGQTELRQQYGVLHDMQSHGNKTLRELESQSFVVLYSLSRGPVLCGPVSSFAVLVLPHWNMGCHWHLF